MKGWSASLVVIAIWGAGHMFERAAAAEVAYVTDDQRDVVSVLDTATHTITATIPVGPGIRPCGLALSPDGETAYVANPSADTVSVIDLATRTTSSIFLRCPSDACQPSNVIVSPDGQFLYTLSEEDFAHMAVTEIDARTRAVTRTFRVNTDGVSSGCGEEAITPDGRLLYVRVVSTAGNSVQLPLALSVIDIATGSELTRLVDPPSTAVVALPSGGAMAAATPEGVAIINTATQAIERLIPITDDLGQIAVNRDGSVAYVVGSHVIFVVDLVEGAVRTTIPLDPSWILWDVAITPDDALLVGSELFGPSIIEIDTATNTLRKTLPLTQQVGNLAVAPDSRTLYAANGTPGFAIANRSFEPAGALLQVDLRNDRATTVLPPAGPSAVVATPDGNQVYVANRLADEVVAIDARLERIETRIQVASPTSFAVDPTRNRILVGSAGAGVGGVTLIDRDTGSVTDSVALDGPVSALAIAPDGRRLYAATSSSRSTPIAVLDAETLTRVATIPTDTSFTALVFSRDGRALYAAASQYGLNEIIGGMAVINPATERVQTMVEIAGGILGLALSPDGETIYGPTWSCCLFERPPELSVFDAASQTLRTTAPLDGAGRIAITAAGDAVYVASRGSVTAIDTATLAAMATVQVGVSSSDIAIAPRPADPTCAGDCDGDGGVNIAELITLVNLALNGDNPEDSACPAMSAWCDGPAISSVSCLVNAVNNALVGCRG